MYKLQTTNQTFAYQLRLQYALTFGDGLIWEKLAIRSTTTKCRLAKHAMRTLSEAWLGEIRASARKQHPNAAFHMIELHLDAFPVVAATNKETC